MQKSLPNRIVIFNQLTSSELADCNLFEDIINDHYLKFNFFYDILSCIDMGTISEIFCIQKENSLHFTVRPLENNILNNIIESINTCEHTNNHKYFNVNTSIKNTELLIIIDLKNKNLKEDVMFYADRFV